MPSILVNTLDGERVDLDAEDGDSIMEAITEDDLDGVEAICGGSLSCATCHVYVAEEWFGKLEPPSENEKDLLAGLEAVNDKSRLSCQLKMSDEFDGIEVTIPSLD